MSSPNETLIHIRAAISSLRQAFVSEMARGAAGDDNATELHEQMEDLRDLERDIVRAHFPEAIAERLLS